MKILTSAGKELRLLMRDRTGLIVLFVMPVILVVVITLVQQNVLQLTGQKGASLLFLDLDKGPVGNELLEHLSQGTLEITHLDMTRSGTIDVKALVTSGTYQIGIVVPEGTSARLEMTATSFFDQKSAGLVPVQIFFDPAIIPSLRYGLTVQIEAVLTAITMQELIKHLEKKLQPLLAISETAQLAELKQGSSLNFFLKKPILVLENDTNSSDTKITQYNPVQQNVPSWALFGVFFISLPIAGGLLNERKSGIWIRLLSLPVSPLVLISGKIVAYIIVCFCQFLIIFLVGSTLFPVMGLPAFTLSAPILSVLLVVLFSGLTACGYGVLLGAFCNTYEQASSFGATTVVIAAAVGGVMVPVYAMPQMMQEFSMISPLNWGLMAFQDLLMRGKGFVEIVDDLGRLFLFFLVTISLASWKLRNT